MHTILISESFDVHDNILSKSQINTLLESTTNSVKLPPKIRENLQNDGVAVIQVIQAGWSHNRNYYSPKVLESLPAAMNSSRIQFLNHSEKDKFERDAKELASYSEYVWYDKTTESVYASVYFPLTKPDTAWLYEVAEKSAEVVGASISSYVEVNEDFTKDGITGNEIIGWPDFQSFDYVLFPSAGGKAIATEKRTESIKGYRKEYESSHKLTRERVLLDYVTLKKYTESVLGKEGAVQDYVDTNIHKSYFWSVLGAIENVFYEILYYDSNTTDSIETQLKSAFDDAYKILASLPFVKNSKSKSKENTMITLEQIKKEAPELLKQIESDALAAAKTDDLKASVESYKGEVTELSGKLKALESDKETLSAENVKLKDANSEFEKQKAADAKKQFIENAIAESKLPEKAVTESFKQRLASYTDEQISAEIKDRVLMWESFSTSTHDDDHQTYEGSSPRSKNTDDDAVAVAAPSDFIN